MASPKNILKGLLLTVALVAAGFGLGLLVNKQWTGQEVPTAEIPAAAHPNNNTYQVSAPNKGRVNFTLSFPLSITGNAGLVLLPKDKAKGLAKDQYVLLYNKNNQALPIVGTISNIAETGDNVTLNIAVEDSPNATADQIARGEAIIDVLKYAQRLPTSALVYHTDESAHVWEVTREAEGTRKTKLRTLQDAPIVIGDFFILPESEYISNVYVLNPDDKLQNEQIIKTSDVLYQAPAVLNPASIEDNQARWVYQLPEKPKASSGAGCSASCGSSGGVTDYISRIKALAQEQADQKARTP